MRLAKRQKFVLNITGYGGVGKSTVCDYLVRVEGFKLYRPSDVIREYARRRGLSIQGNQDYIECLKSMLADKPDSLLGPVYGDDHPRICIDGLRSPLFMGEFKNKYAAHSIVLAASVQERYARVCADLSRSGHRVPPSVTDFIADEAKDRYNPDQRLPNVEAMIANADAVIDTDGRTTEQVIKAVLKVIDQWPVPAKVYKK